jgi:hypothetical protein
VRQLRRALVSVAVPIGRILWLPNAWLRWAVWSALIAALVGAVAATTIQIHINRDCKGGAFSSGFSSGFDIRRCGVTFEHIPTRTKITIPLPASWAVMCRLLAAKRAAEAALLYLADPDPQASRARVTAYLHLLLAGKIAILPLVRW